MFRTWRDTSMMKADCDRFIIMNSWTIRVFEKLMSAAFARLAMIIDGTGGFTSACGPPRVQFGWKVTSWNAGSTAVSSPRRLWITWIGILWENTFISWIPSVGWTGGLFPRKTRPQGLG